MADDVPIRPVRVPRPTPPVSLPWDQLPAESDVEYDQFLAYLNLPVHLRSIKRAYQNYLKTFESVRRSVDPPGSVVATATRRNWLQRAAVYDAAQLNQQRSRSYALHYQLLNSMYEKACRFIGTITPDSPKWAGALETMTILGNQLAQFNHPSVSVAPATTNTHVRNQLTAAAVE